MKKQFEVGDRVRVYGTSDGEANFSYGAVAITLEAESKNRMLVQFQNGGREKVLVHPKQCRRLKPKPKPEVKEARRVFVFLPSNADRGLALGNEQAVMDAQFSFKEVFQCREVLPTDIVTSEEGLAKAWDEFVQCPTVKMVKDHVESAAYAGFLKALKQGAA